VLCKKCKAKYESSYQKSKEAEAEIRKSERRSRNKKFQVIEIILSLWRGAREEQNTSTSKDVSQTKIPYCTSIRHRSYRAHPESI
jgi:hypothetical protein